MSDQPMWATQNELIIALRSALDVAHRLPVEGATCLDGVLSTIDRALSAAESIGLCSPALAVGTHRFREVHGLPPIKETTA